ncbi:MAG: alpha/beta fold hydrolase [Xanthomonadaceae bacterium]|nr:alpha/beta fold hydrolase [Xanthomonadaceae bacterium]
MNTQATEIPAPFNPPGWLANPHLQSLLASATLRKVLVDSSALRAASTSSLIECGDGVRLLASHARQPDAGPGTPLVVLIHGWEGSAESSYLLAAAAALHREGAEVVRLNLRDHGDTHHLNEEIFHSCRLDEAVGAVAAIARAHPGRPLYLAGWSLGGNFTVRIADRAPAAGFELTHAVAVSPVVDPANSYLAMERGLFIYRWYFLRKWRRSLARKQAAHPHLFDFSEVMRMTDLREMTAHLVDKFGEFRTVDDYFAGYALNRGMLEGATQPLTVITAADDPIIPAADFAGLRSGGHFHLEVHPHGGHCGFMTGVGPHSWVDARLCDIIIRGRC